MEKVGPGSQVNSGELSNQNMDLGTSQSEPRSKHGSEIPLSDPTPRVTPKTDFEVSHKRSAMIYTVYKEYFLQKN